MNGCRRSLSFDQVLEGCWLLLSLQEIDLEWREEKLVEEQAWSLYSFDGRDLLAEQEEFCKRMAGVESERPAEAVQLSWSVREILDTPVDLSMFPFWDIPDRLKSAQDVLTAASLILEHL
jgi:hypothetical protein